MKKIFILFTLLFTTMILFNSTTYAYQHDVGLNLPNVFPFLDEFEFDSTSGNVVNYTKTGGLTTHTYTLVFKDTTPNILDDMFILLGARFDDIELVTLYDERVNYFQIASFEGSTNKLANYMIPIIDETYLDNPTYLSIKSDHAGLRTFIETYLYIIYDTQDDIINRTIQYYESLANSAGYDEGYDDGFDDAIATGVGTGGYVTGYNNGYIVGEIEGYENGQNDMFQNGSATYGYDFENAYDYEVGYDIGSLKNVNAGMTTFMIGFEKWIIPAILIIMFLGGYYAIRSSKNKGE